MVEYHADLKQVQSDAQLCALLGDGVQSAPFDRLAWWQGLTEHCVVEPLLAVARDGECVAVLPLRRSGAGYEALANWYSFRFRPIASSPGDAPSLLHAIAESLAGRTRRITLSGISDEDSSTQLLSRVFKDAGWTVFSDVCDINHILFLNNRSYADYLSTRPGPLRTTLRRKSGKVVTKIREQFDTAAWADFEDVYRESWKPAEGSPEFLRSFAEAEGAAGRLRLGIARDEGGVVAAQLWTVEGHTAFIHKLAHREAAKALSPGTVLSAALFEHAIDRDKVQLIDFGTGDDPYKRDWMEQTRPRYRLQMLRPRHPGNWPIIARAFASRLAGRVNHG